MFRKTFLGAIIRLIISHTAVSKSMLVNLKSLRKKGGTLIVLPLLEEDILINIVAE